MSYVENRVLSDELKNVFEEFKHIHAESKNEIKALGEETKETRNTIEKIHDRLDQVETKLSRPRIQLTESNDQEESEYKKAFDKWFTTGDDTEIKLTSMNETVDPDGGYLVPPQYSNFLIESLVEWSPIRRYARVVKTNSKEFRIPVQAQAQDYQTGAAQSGLFPTGWTSDVGPVPQTVAGKLRMVSIPTNDLYALPAASQDLVDDSAYGNIESYIQKNLAKSIALAEGTAFVKGNGVGQPLGLLTGDEFVTVNTGNAVGFAAIDAADVIFNAYYALPDYYARQGVWFMNRQTIRIVREFADGNGQYLWTPSFGNTLPNEAPATILSRPYAECIDMDAPVAINGDVYNAGDIPILFGSAYDAYTIVDRMGIRMLRDPYTSKPFILYYTTFRVGGTTVLPEAMVKVQCAV